MSGLLNGFNNGRDRTDGIGGRKPIDWVKIKNDRRLNVEQFLNNKTMEQYLGVKLVSAELCSQDQFAGAKNFGDLSKLSGGIDREGYKVVYEDGYTSWSPKDVFEKAYKIIKENPNKDINGNDLSDFQKRVFTEAFDLKIKIQNLQAFIFTNQIFKSLNEDEQLRLKQQLMAMQYYLTILVERIQNF